MKKSKTLITLLLFCLMLIPVSAQDVKTVASEGVNIEVKDSSVLLAGMNIAEKSKGQNYVSSNLMVTYSMGAGKVASTASVPSKYSSTGALVQSDFGDGVNWYYLKEVDENGENVFEGKEKVTVSWEYPLLEGQGWKPAIFRDNLMEIPEGEDTHFITNGNLVLPGQFVIYSADDDDEEAKTPITDPAKDCSSPSRRCSATLKTGELEEGYYYVVYTWQSGGKTYISNSQGVKIGDPGDNGKAIVIINDALTGEQNKLSWTPKYAQYYGKWGNINRAAVNVYKWNDNPSGISIGSSTNEVKYDLGSLGLSGLTFTVETDWKTHTTLVFNNNKEIDLEYDVGKILLKPSESGDWGNGIVLTNISDQLITLSKGQVITEAENASQVTAPSELPKESSAAVEEYSPKYAPNDWLSVSAAEEKPQVMLSSLVGVPVDYDVLSGIDIKRDIAEIPIIGFSRISGSKIRFSNLAGSSNMVYSWDFGDGSMSEEQNPVHKYKKSGGYLVKLTATDSGGNKASQLSIVTIKRAGFFGSILSIFGYEGGDEGYADKEKDLGGLIVVSSKEPVRVSSKKGYYFSTTNRYLATVDANGVVRFADEFVPGSSVGIIASNDDERFMTLIKYVEEGSEKPNAVFIADPPVDLKGNANAISFTATSENIEGNLVLAASETSDVGTEEIKEHVKGGILDMISELLKLKGEEWSKAYDLIRKMFEGAQTGRAIPESSCKCLEHLRDFLKSGTEEEAALSFWEYCFCIYSMSGNAGATVFGYYACFGMENYAPNPLELPSDALTKMKKSVDDLINECKEPGYIERKAKECEEAKKDCEKAKQLVEEAKKLIEEFKKLAQESASAAEQAQLAKERAERAWQDVYNAADVNEAVKAANRAARAAREAEDAADLAARKSNEAKAKDEQARSLLAQALELCPGRCDPEDGSSAVRSSIYEGYNNLHSAPNHEYSSSNAKFIAWEAGSSAEAATEFASAKLVAHQKKSCEKALEYAKAASRTAERITPASEGIEKRLQEITDTEAMLKQLEEKAMNIMTKERFEKGIKLQGIANDAGAKVKSAEKALEDISKLQAEISKMADDARRMASIAEQALAEGDPEDPKCMEAKKLIQQARDRAAQAVTAASDAMSSAQQKLDSAKQSKKKIDEIRDEWEKKRRTIRCYTYTNSDGETVTWGGNGDAQPPEGATYHGTMQNGQWTDGGPPKIS